MVGANHRRPITSLTKVEVLHLAIGAVSGWTLKRAEQEARERDARGKIPNFFS